MKFGVSISPRRGGGYRVYLHAIPENRGPYQIGTEKDTRTLWGASWYAKRTCKKEARFLRDQGANYELEFK